MRIILSIIILALSINSTKAEGLINWMSLQEALDAQAKNYKPIFLDAYTDWCGWCKKMDQNTFNHPEIAKLIGNYYYPVKFDAECNDTIVFQGKTYINSGWSRYEATLKEYEIQIAAGNKVRKPRKPTHDLTAVLLKGKLSYPTIVYIQDQGRVIPVPGYQDPKKIQPQLIWVGENASKTTPYDQFLASFNVTFQTPNANKHKVNWIGIEKALELQKTDKKDILIFFDANWSTTCKMMHNSFSDSSIVAYLNDNYHCVLFDAISKEPVTAFGHTFTNESEKPALHQFTSYFLSKNLAFPAIVFLSPEQKPVGFTNYFFTSEALEKIIKYYGDDHYKTESWELYLKRIQSGK